jgi:hypothetical protein
LTRAHEYCIGDMCHLRHMPWLEAVESGAIIQEPSFSPNIVDEF